MSKSESGPGLTRGGSRVFYNNRGAVELQVGGLVADWFSAKPSGRRTSDIFGRDDLLLLAEVLDLAHT